VWSGPVAGSYRRRKGVVHDLDFIVPRGSRRRSANISSRIPCGEHPGPGPTKSSVRLKSGVQADLRVVNNEPIPYALVYFTGSKEHNIVLRNRALQKRLDPNEYGWLLWS